MLCPNCGKLISVNAERCYHCGMKNPGAFHNVPWLQKIFSGRFSYVSAIIIFCTVLYVVALLLDLRALLQFHNLLSLFSPSTTALYLLGMTGQIPIANGRWWTLVTAIYLHGGILHILFNMLWIHQMGPMVEELFGAARFFIIFTIAGIIGFIASYLFGIAFTIGASGAIFGLFGALVFYGRHRGGHFGRQIFRQTMQWVVIIIFLGFMMPMVDNTAHIGGFAGGYLIAMLIGYQEKSPEKLLHRKIALGLVIVTGLAFLASVFGL